MVGSTPPSANGVNGSTHSAGCGGKGGTLDRGASTALSAPRRRGLQGVVGVARPVSLVNLTTAQAKVGGRSLRTLAVIKNFRLPGCHLSAYLWRVVFVGEPPPCAGQHDIRSQTRLGCRRLQHPSASRWKHRQSRRWRRRRCQPALIQPPVREAPAVSSSPFGRHKSRHQHRWRR